MKKQFLETGKIVGTHGIAGEMRVELWSDSPDLVCNTGTLYFDEGKKCIEVERARPHKSLILLKIKNVDTMNDAVALRGKIIFINRDDVALDKGSFFIQDLIGLDVVDDHTNQSYGTLTDVSRTGANDVYHIKDTQGKETLIPAIPDVIISTDIEGGVMRIHPLRGLFDHEN